MSTNGKSGGTTTIGARVPLDVKADFRDLAGELGMNETTAARALIDWFLEHRRLPGDADAEAPRPLTAASPPDDESPEEELSAPRLDLADFAEVVRGVLREELADAPAPEGSPQDIRAIVREELAGAIVVARRLSERGSTLDVASTINVVRGAFLNGRIQEELKGVSS